MVVEYRLSRTHQYRGGEGKGEEGGGGLGRDRYVLEAGHANQKLKEMKSNKLRLSDERRSWERLRCLPYPPRTPYGPFIVLCVLSDVP